MIVYGSTISPFVRKVMAFAGEKGLDVQLTAIGLGNRDPEFLEASPLGKMPALRDGDFTISDSTAIVTYLDAAYPARPLIPADAKGRARAIWWDEYGDTVLFGCFGKIFLNRMVRPVFLKQPGDEVVAQAAEREEMPKLLDWLEQAIPASGFLLEDRITLADVAVASPFVNMEHVGVSIAAWPKVAGYVERILARPSFAAMVEKERAFVAKVRG